MKNLSVRQRILGTFAAGIIELTQSQLNYAGRKCAKNTLANAQVFHGLHVSRLSVCTNLSAQLRNPGPPGCSIFTAMSGLDMLFAELRRTRIERRGSILGRD